MQFKLDPNVLNVLKMSRLPNAIFTTKPFEVKTLCASYTSQPTQDHAPLNVSVKKQMDVITRCVENPFHKPYTLAIGAKVDEKYALCLAAMVYQAAIQQYDTQGLHRPVWLTLDNSFNNRFLEQGTPAGLLIISNLKDDSPKNKIEKVRDLLAHYDRNPRLVVYTGCDPIAFFDNILKCDLNYSVYLASRRIQATAY